MFKIETKIIAFMAVLAVIGIVGWYIKSLEETINGLEKDVTILEVGLNEARSATEVEKANSARLRATIEEMNTATEELTKKHDSMIAEYETYKSKPKEVRYEVLYKYVEGGKSNECEDIKSAIDSVSSYVNDRMH